MNRAENEGPDGCVPWEQHQKEIDRRLHWQKTLARWSIILNCHEWPEDLPQPPLSGKCRLEQEAASAGAYQVVDMLLDVDGRAEADRLWKASNYGMNLPS